MGLFMPVVLTQGAPPPSASRAQAVLEAQRSQRSKDHPLSDTPQPIQASPCAVPAPACRHIDFFDLRLSDSRVVRIEVNADLDYLKDGALTLFPGESVTLRLDGAGPVIIGGGVASTNVTPEELRPITDDLRQNPRGDLLPVTAPADKPAPPAADPGTLRITFTQPDGRAESLLNLQSGLDKLFAYRAQMSLPSGASQPTDVCEVLAQKTGYEFWPDPIIALSLSQMATSEPRADGSIQCK